jgi:hypothetical protein
VLARPDGRHDSCLGTLLTAASEQVELGKPWRVCMSDGYATGSHALGRTSGLLPWGRGLDSGLGRWGMWRELACAILRRWPVMCSDVHAAKCMLRCAWERLVGDGRDDGCRPGRCVQARCRGCAQHCGDPDDSPGVIAARLWCSNGMRPCLERLWEPSTVSGDMQGVLKPRGVLPVWYACPVW